MDVGLGYVEFICDVQRRDATPPRAPDEDGPFRAIVRDAIRPGLELESTHRDPRTAARDVRNDPDCTISPILRVLPDLPPDTRFRGADGIPP